MAVRARIGDRALCGLFAAMLPPEHGGPDPQRMALSLAELLEHQPRVVSSAVRMGALGLDAASLVTNRKRLRSADTQQREALIGRLSAARPLRDGIDGLKALTLLVAGAEREAPAMIERTRLSSPARPDAELDVVGSFAVTGRPVFDAVVVGSGAGGAMAARTLARAGMSVAVVEEGRRHLVEEFRTAPPLERFGSLYRDGGLTAALGRPPVVLPVGRGVGGTTLVNSGTCYRTPEEVLRRWRDEAGLELADPDTFGTYLDDVWRTLEVAPVPGTVMGNNGRLMLEGAARLGWRSNPLQRNAPGCDGCCQCSIGCPDNAKLGVHLSALPEACAAGARIISDARVERVLIDGGRARGVLVHRPDGSLLEIGAREGVVVAAGATETPPLLRRSGLGDHRMLGRNLALHPALSVAGRFEEPVVAWRGVLQSAAVEEFHDEDGLLVEATSAPPGMGSMLLPGFGAELVKELEDADHLATLGAMVADQPSGRVIGRRRALTVYVLSRDDGRRLIKAIGVMGRVMFAAGAIEVTTGIPGHMRVRDEAGLEEALGAADPRSLHLAAFHPVGTAAAGADPAIHPVDEHGALRGSERVWVTDASVLPTCPTVNPQVTVMAMALAIADCVVRGSRP
jgi:choline dehydrogenase-like flavoprotein